MDVDPGWIIAAAGAFAAIVGGLIARDRYVLRLITQGDDKLHERINRTRDEYVRRDDLDHHVLRLDASVQSLSKDFKEVTKALTDDIKTIQKEQNSRFDALLIALQKREGKQG